MFFTGERLTLESIIDDYDCEFTAMWVLENFVFTQATQEGQAAMYRTMRDAFINKAMEAIEADLKGSGEKYFYDILAAR